MGRIMDCEMTLIQLRVHHFTAKKKWRITSSIPVKGAGSDKTGAVTLTNMCNITS